MEGWLLKRGPTKSYSWEPRWCVLSVRKARLAYYEDQDQLRKKGDIELIGTVRVCQFSSKSAPGDAPLYSNDRAYGFLLEVGREDGRQPRLFYFDAQDAALLDRWTKALTLRRLTAIALERPPESLVRMTVDERSASLCQAGQCSGLASCSSSEEELELKPPKLVLPRRLGHSAEVHGASNAMFSHYIKPSFRKSNEHRAGLRSALLGCPFFSHMSAETIEDLIDAMPIEDVQDGNCIMRQGESGSGGYVILSGEAAVYREQAMAEQMVGLESSRTPPARREKRQTVPDMQPFEAPVAGSAGGEERTFVRTMLTGRFFGETAMLFCVPRARSVYASGPVTLARLEREVYQELVVRKMVKTRMKKEECLRKVKMLEALDDEQLAQIVDVFEEVHYAKGDDVIVQGEVGHEMFVILAGECHVTVATGTLANRDVQEVKRYTAGDMFGEIALLHRCTRTATVTAWTTCHALKLGRRQMTPILGDLGKLQQEKYHNDPRKIIADFYQPGDHRGPRGACAPPPMQGPGVQTHWFAVYRPTSRDAIAKMLNGVAVGKGLNIKGKSAKKNRLSGFVPFLQISNQAHKADIGDISPDARLKIFFHTDISRLNAIRSLEPLLRPEAGLAIDTERTINLIDSYQDVFGIDVPVPVVVEAYIMKPNIAFMIGWETGRQSEPEFMKMNLAALRGGKGPEVVLYCVDNDNPMNPHGLVMAYAEVTVKPVVSDFDTFTIGSRYQEYTALPEEQVDLAKWALEETTEILKSPGPSSWNTRWLHVLREADHPEMPEFGFGDSTSYDLTEAVVQATSEVGAIRHGAECFNYFFPQELDEDYLVVWEGYAEQLGKPWVYLSFEELPIFLLDRIREGFIFPINPVWAVRDEGWYEVFQELLAQPAGRVAYDSWFPAESGILEQIEAIHTEFPDGFKVVHHARDRAKSGNNDDDDDDDPGRVFRSISQVGDLESREKADLVVSLSRARCNWVKATKTLKSVRRASLHANKHGSADLDGAVGNISSRGGHAAFGL